MELLFIAWFILLVYSLLLIARDAYFIAGQKKRRRENEKALARALEQRQKIIDSWHDNN
jgi:hypothetical protein